MRTNFKVCRLGTVDLRATKANHARDDGNQLKTNFCFNVEWNKNVDIPSTSVVCNVASTGDFTSGSKGSSSAWHTAWHVLKEYQDWIGARWIQCGEGRGTSGSGCGAEMRDGPVVSGARSCKNTCNIS